MMYQLPALACTTMSSLSTRSVYVSPLTTSLGGFVIWSDVVRPLPASGVASVGPPVYEKPTNVIVAPSAWARGPAAEPEMFRTTVRRSGGGLGSDGSPSAGDPAVTCITSLSI